jgi:hypothetical protein
MSAAVRRQDYDRHEKAFLRDVGRSQEPPTDRAGQEACPSPDLVMAEAAEVLPADAAARAREHVERCPTCQMLIRDLTDSESLGATRVELARIRRRVFGSIEATRQPAWGWLWKPGLAAAAAAAVLAVSVWVGIGPEVALRPPEGPALPVPAELRAVSVLRLERPAIQLPGAALIWRGSAGASEDSLLRDLRLALEPFDRGDWVAAQARLERVAQGHPSSAHARFYLGVSRLFGSSAREAVGPLEAARRLGAAPLAADAAWYLVLAYDAAGRAGDALQVLDELCTGSSGRAALACAGAQELRARTP